MHQLWAMTTSQWEASRIHPHLDQLQSPEPHHQIGTGETTKQLLHQDSEVTEGHRQHTVPHTPEQYMKKTRQLKAGLSPRVMRASRSIKRRQDLPSGTRERMALHVHHSDPTPVFNRLRTSKIANATRAGRKTSRYAHVTHTEAAPTHLHLPQHDPQVLLLLQGHTRHESHERKKIAPSDRTH